MVSITRFPMPGHADGTWFGLQVQHRHSSSGFLSQMEPLFNHSGFLWTRLVLEVSIGLLLLLSL